MCKKDDIAYNETFILLVKMTSICIFLGLATLEDLKVH